MNRFIIATLLVTVGQVGQAKDYVCEGWTLKSSEYLNEYARDTLEPKDVATKPFVLRNYPDDPYFALQEKTPPLKKLLPERLPFQGALYWQEGALDTYNLFSIESVGFLNDDTPGLEITRIMGLAHWITNCTLIPD